MRYEYAFDLQRLAEDISIRCLPHVKINRIKCFRSYGTSSKHTIARCHALGKLMQLAMAVDAFYALEFITEKFNKLSEKEKVKVVIHELMHIPEGFGGGFKQHHIVTDRNVDKCYEYYLEMRRTNERGIGLSQSRKIVKLFFVLFLMEFSFEHLGSEKKVKVNKVPWYKEGFGLMFVSPGKAKPLLFDLKRPVKMSIHSYFVRFSFVAIWLDEEKKVIEIKQIRPSRGLIKPKRPFRYLVEIPMIPKYDAEVRNLLSL